MNVIFKLRQGASMGSNCWMVGWSVEKKLHDDWVMGFRCWSLIGQNKFTLQTSADARVAPGSCTVQYLQLIISVQRLE